MNLRNEFSRPIRHPPRRAETQRGLVVVAMSGGVDSSRSPLYCHTGLAVVGLTINFGTSAASPTSGDGPRSTVVAHSTTSPTPKP